MVCCELTWALGNAAWPEASAFPLPRHPTLHIQFFCGTLFAKHLLAFLFLSLRLFVFFFGIAFKTRCHINFTSYKSRKIFYCLSLAGQTEEPNSVHIFLSTLWNINYLEIKGGKPAKAVRVRLEFALKPRINLIFHLLSVRLEST